MKSVTDLMTWSIFRCMICQSYDRKACEVKAYTKESNTS